MFKVSLSGVSVVLRIYRL